MFKATYDCRDSGPSITYQFERSQRFGNNIHFRPQVKCTWVTSKVMATNSELLHYN
jgi:hypothetical protein